MEQKSRGAIVGGSILIALGVAFVFIQYFGLGGGIVLAGLGLAFLVTWAVTRTYGLLIPGAVLAGLGVGVGLNEAGVADAVVLSLGIAFLLIPLLDAVWTRELSFSRGGWWPLIPGTILVLVGVGIAFPELGSIVSLLKYAWPIALIVGGVWIIWAGVRGTKSSSE